MLFPQVSRIPAPVREYLVNKAGQFLKKEAAKTSSPIDDEVVPIAISVVRELLGLPYHDE